ncbi:cation transporter [Sphingopyxis sp. SE2]|nr:cation transporter [Sphingopyxis sp. SE2]MDT7531213.1 cation transporter [Sphingopyxis sp. SE2]
MKMIFRAVVASAVALGVTTGAVAAPRTATLQVENVGCVTCVPIVKRMLSRQAGVSKVAVVEKDGTATATILFEDSKVSAKALATAVSDAGYPAVVKRVR